MEGWGRSAEDAHDHGHWDSALIPEEEGEPGAGDEAGLDAMFRDGARGDGAEGDPGHDGLLKPGGKGRE